MVPTRSRSATSSPARFARHQLRILFPAILFLAGILPCRADLAVTMDLSVQDQVTFSFSGSLPNIATPPFNSALHVVRNTYGRYTTGPAPTATSTIRGGTLGAAELNVSNMSVAALSSGGPTDLINFGFSTGLAPGSVFANGNRAVTLDVSADTYTALRAEPSFKVMWGFSGTVSGAFVNGPIVGDVTKILDPVPGMIAWSPVESFSDTPAQVLNNGWRHTAVGFSPAPFTINGVTFDPIASNGATASGSQITVSSLLAQSIVTVTGGDYRQLLSYGSFHQSNSGSLTVDGLTAGGRYQVQLFMPFWDDSFTAAFGSANGGTVVLNTGFGASHPDPDVVTGTFLASGTTQEITYAPAAPSVWAGLAAVSVRRLDAIVPVVATAAAGTLTSTSAVLGGEVTDDGGAGVTERGIVWATTANPTTSNAKVANGSGTGAFSATVGGFTAGSTFHVRAYATNPKGTSYGSDLEVTLPGLPTVASVSPGVGLLAGGSFTITGTNFAAGATVTVGGVAATNVVVVNATTITATAPAGSLGTKEVVVTVGGTSASGLYRYTDLVVTQTGNSGAGSLREALIDAMTLPGADLVTFAAGLSGQSIELVPPTVPGTGNDSGLVIDDTGGVTIDASALPAGLALTKATPAQNCRVFYLRTGSLTLKCLTLADAGGNLPGGAIFSSGTLSLERCTLVGNSGDGNNGGALYNNGTAVIQQCTITGNAANNGGGIHNNGTLTLHHTTVALNSASTSGGGVYLESSMTLENSIVAANTAATGGADISNAAPLTLVGANLVPHLSAPVAVNGSGSVSPADPLLSPLAANGGPTLTMAIRFNSPAVNASIGSTVTADQRGIAVAGVPDLGATEHQPTLTYAGTGFGPIPDNNGGNRDIHFTVAGQPGAVKDVTVGFTLSPAHPMLSDVRVQLISPDNKVHGVFGVNGSDNTDLAGPYTFNDAATQWIGQVSAATGDVPIAPGLYKTEFTTGLTSLQTSFGGTEPNGVWTLRFTDRAAGNTASVSTASLTLATAPEGKLALQRQANGPAVLDLSLAEPAANYAILRSTDLKTWTLLQNVTTSGNGTASVIHSNPPAGRSFYRCAPRP